MDQSPNRAARVPAGATSHDGELESERERAAARRPSRVQRLNASRARLAKALEEVPRRLFLPPELANLPDEEPAPLPNGSFIPPVSVVRMMVGALELQGDERVLDVGSGSGYQAALLGRLAREVISLELDEELARQAVLTLSSVGATNVRVVHADGCGGWAESAPYQAIVVGAAVAELPYALVDQLDLGGRLVVALGNEDAQLAECLCRDMDSLASKTLGACRLDMLATARRSPSSFPWSDPGR